jgi:hypothetical protein
MDTRPTTYRQLKRYLRDRLLAEDFSGALSAALELPARKAVNPLISFFCDRDVMLRWRSVSALGAVVARLADENRESARVVMRRLMWSLNDESGGIGWGAPEAMGEITARHAGMAGEYGHILLSYLAEDGNYLEHEVLQRGALWGCGRLAHARPERVKPAAGSLFPFLASADPYHRGYAAWALRPLALAERPEAWAACLKDPSRIPFYAEGVIHECTVAELVAGNLPVGDTAFEKG